MVRRGRTTSVCEARGPWDVAVPLQFARHINLTSCDHNSGTCHFMPARVTLCMRGIKLLAILFLSWDIGVNVFSGILQMHWQHRHKVSEKCHYLVNRHRHFIWQECVEINFQICPPPPKSYHTMTLFSLLSLWCWILWLFPDPCVSGNMTDRTALEPFFEVPLGEANNHSRPFIAKTTLNHGTPYIFLLT